MPAFIAMVEGDEGYVGGVYFAKSNIEARRRVCDEWQDGELGGAIVRRARHFDKYEETGRVPMSDMMLEGWWSECSECGTKLTCDEQYDADDNEFILDPDEVIGDFGYICFCCQECHDTYHHKKKTERAMKAELENMMQAKIESKFGVDGIDFYDSFHAYIRWRDGAPYVKDATLRFNVPGCKHGGCWYKLVDTGGVGEPKYEVTVAQGDFDAFAAFYRERTGLVLDKGDSRA